MSNRVVYSYDKTRKVEEPYKFVLPELYRKIAREELHEEDVVREQALTQMREWIVANSYIRKCRTDAPFLLRFLRFRQFSVPAACEALEQYLTVREMYPSWFKAIDFSDPQMRLARQMAGISVLGQDSTGRTQVMIQLDQTEGSQLTPLQLGRFVTLLLEGMMELEEVQIGGMTLLLDYTGISLKLFEGWGATEYKIIMDGFTRYFPVRYQELHGAKLPKLAVSALEHFLSFMPPKLREKVQCHAKIEELQQLMEPSITPEEYGGKVKLNEFANKFWERLEQRGVTFTAGWDQFEIDMDHYNALWEKQNPDMAESKNFKQLNID